MSAVTQVAIDLAEHGRIPDSVLRRGMRLLLARRLAGLASHDCELAADAERNLIRHMRSSPIAPDPHKANEQHYALPPEFFAQVLGPRRKYSCCHWGEGVKTLDAAEADALAVTCERAGLEDGMGILDLGCGWGALSLWMAEIYPRSRILAVSNSALQAAHIQEQAKRRGLGNVRVLTQDMNDFDTAEHFDRVVSVEMFEHMRNWWVLFRQIHAWLEPGGQFFMHIFCHRNVPYAFEDKGPSDWMSRHFFTAGLMPSDGLPLRFQQQLRLLHRWRWSGRHYERTANAWLANMDERRDAILPILAGAYGATAAETWWMRRRMFFMACAELFGYHGGEEWWVSHYLFERPSPR
jgi:cyclopropane-fatty-acyl-phospholipid synthase